MRTCYICEAELTDENKTIEHIILNAIGGRLKSSHLICCVCNSILGHTTDSELARQFSFLAGHLQIKRDKGSIPTIKGGVLADGTPIHLVDGIFPTLGKPKFEYTPVAEGIKFNLTARDESEMKTLLQGIKKKYPNFDVGLALQQAKHYREKLKEPVQYEQQFGGALAFRAIAKSALNFFMFNRGERNQIVHLIDYIKGINNLDIVKPFYPPKPYKKEPNEVIHLLHLVGDKYKKVALLLY